MTKIMLVEDDKSLREIYGIRLQAEGYDIISAGDGEEALAMAVKEHPDLILSDVMMPKISGFDMLDILRATPETKDVKVIMMTALSSEDQRSRGESLGANRYLVKSQVGIEDVVRTVADVLSGATAVAPVADPEQSRGTPAPVTPAVAQIAEPTPVMPAPAAVADPEQGRGTPAPIQPPQPVVAQPAPQMPQPAAPQQSTPAYEPFPLSTPPPQPEVAAAPEF